MINEAYELLRNIETKINHKCDVTLFIKDGNLYVNAVVDIKRKNKIIQIPYSVPIPFYEHDKHFIQHYVDNANGLIRKAYKDE